MQAVNFEGVIALYSSRCPADPGLHELTITHPTKEGYTNGVLQ